MKAEIFIIPVIQHAVAPEPTGTANQYYYYYVTYSWYYYSYYYTTYYYGRKLLQSKFGVPFCPLVLP